MYDYLDFTSTGTKDTGKEIKLMVLTTCGFCHKGRAYLDDNDVQYKFIEVDKLSLQTKKQIKMEFAEKFDTRLVYPTLIVDDSEFITGFKKQTWADKLGL